MTTSRKKTMTTKINLENVDIPVFFWLGSDGLKSKTKEEFNVEIRRARRDAQHAAGDFSEEGVGG